MYKYSKAYKEDQYYEAILQLRPYDEKLVEFVEKKIAEKDNVYITKVVRKKFGIDFYLNSKRFATSLGNQIKRHFKGSLKTSGELYKRDRQTSKEIYRVTVCFRLDNN